MNIEFVFTLDIETKLQTDQINSIFSFIIYNVYFVNIFILLSTSLSISFTNTIYIIITDDIQKKKTEEVLITTSQKQEIKGLYNNFINRNPYNGLYLTEKPDKLSDELVKQYEDLLDIFELSEKLQISYILLKIKIFKEASYIVIKENIYIYSDNLIEIRTFQKINKNFFNI